MANSRLDAAYAAQVRAVRERVDSFTQARFAAGEHRDADLERFVAQVVPVVLAARRQVSALTDAYLAQVLSEVLGRRVRPRGPIDTDLLRGVAASEVYARPFVEVRTKLSEGLAYDAAVSASAARLTDITLADMQLAKTHTAQARINVDGVRGYKRTLTGSKNCALCYLASTQFYHRADLLPIHPGCDCGVQPIAVGDRVNMDADLAATHEAVEARFGAADASGRDIGLGDPRKDYAKVVLVRDHGELGPVLTVKSQRFTREKAIPKQRLGFQHLTREQVEHQLGVLRDLPDSDYKRRAVAKYEARLAELS